MENSFKVTVNDQHNFSISRSQVKALDVAGNCRFHVIKNHQSLSGEIISGDFDQRIYEIEINANRYKVKISDALDQLINEMGLSDLASKESNELKAPMPGMILDLMVEVGQEVSQGDSLLVLEAMKMENTLTAPRDGMIKSLHIEKGQTVEKNQLLIEMGQEESQD